MTDEASKFLNFDDEESEKAIAEVDEGDQEGEDAFKDFHELEQRSSNENVKKPKLINPAEKEMCASQGTIAAYVAPLESEALVEWKDTNRLEPSENNTDDDCVLIQRGLSQMNNVARSSNHVFAFNSFDEKVNCMKFIFNTVLIILSQTEKGRTCRAC